MPWDRPREYDRWYADHPEAFSQELELVRPLFSLLGRPVLEIGVGTGRFAGALGADLGLDLSVSFVKYARKHNFFRPLLVADAATLPIKEGALGGVALFFTLSFLSRRWQLFRELGRVLRGGGGLLVLDIGKGSPLAERALSKRENPWWSELVGFLDLDDLIRLSAVGGLSPVMAVAKGNGLMAFLAIKTT